ncbi:LTA synthase family protein [Paenibacillus ferrarius]|uniref:LTA synthase family protein n=1 Tax=Paenibacillus ferrarius TaxID=1469647 RepID=UPI003D2BBAFE
MYLQTSRRRSARHVLPVRLMLALTRNGLLIWTFAAILLKSQLLLAALHAPDNQGLSISNMYFTVPPVLSHLMFIVFWVAIGLFFRSRGRRIYLLAFNILFSIGLMCDLIYYRAYAAFLSLRFVLHPAGFNPLGLDLWSYARLFDLWFAADLLVLGIYGLFRLRGRSSYSGGYGGRNGYGSSYGYSGYATRTDGKRRRPVLAVVLMLLAVGVVETEHYRIDVKNVTNGQMLFFNLSWAPFQSMSDMSPIGYHLYDGLRLFGSNKLKSLTSQEDGEIKAWLSANNEHLPDNAYKGKFQGKNLFVIQVESLEAFVLNQKVNGQEITPNLNRLMGNSLYFSNFYEQVNNGTSSDSDLMTTTSTYPIRYGANFFRYPTNTYHSLPNLMAGLGYQTVSTHSEPAGSWNWVEAHHSIGYQTSWDLRQYKVDDVVGLGLSDESYLRQLGEKVGSLQQPFLLHVITLSSHGPFDMPKATKELQLDPAFDSSIMGAYFQAIHYTDKQIGAFLDKLQQLGLLEQSVVAIYGDHTGVHKYYQDQVDAMPPMENEAWRTHTLKLPFMVYQPGLEGETIPTVGGQIDTLPTLAYLMGVDPSAFAEMAMGKVLLNTQRDYTMLNDGTIVGTPPTEADKQHLLSAFHIADLIHESDYFAE